MFSRLENIGLSFIDWRTAISDEESPLATQQLFGSVLKRAMDLQSGQMVNWFPIEQVTLLDDTILHLNRCARLDCVLPIHGRVFHRLEGLDLTQFEATVQ